MSKIRHQKQTSTGFVRLNVSHSFVKAFSLAFIAWAHCVLHKQHKTAEKKVYVVGLSFNFTASIRISVILGYFCLQFLFLVKTHF